ALRCAVLWAASAHRHPGTDRDQRAAGRWPGPCPCPPGAYRAGPVAAGADGSHRDSHRKSTSVFAADHRFLALPGTDALFLATGGAVALSRWRTRSARGHLEGLLADSAVIPRLGQP